MYVGRAASHQNPAVTKGRGAPQAQTRSEGVLNDLVDARISIDRPADGFRIVDGEMPVVEGRVLDDSNLEALEANGIDILGDLGDDRLTSLDPQVDRDQRRSHSACRPQSPGRHPAGDTASSPGYWPAPAGQ